MAINNARLYREAQEAIAKKDEALTLLHAVLLDAGRSDHRRRRQRKNGLRNQVATDFWCSRPRLQELENYEGYFTALHPDGRVFQNEEWPLSRALRTGEVRVGEELEIVKLNGQRSFVRANSAPVRDRVGNIIAAAVAFEDVTKRRLADRALRESEENSVAWPK